MTNCFVLFPFFKSKIRCRHVEKTFSYWRSIFYLIKCYFYQGTKHSKVFVRNAHVFRTLSVKNSTKFLLSFHCSKIIFRCCNFFRGESVVLKDSLDKIIYNTVLFTRKALDSLIIDVGKRTTNMNDVSYVIIALDI